MGSGERPALPSQFDVSDLGGKMECKRELQREMGFEVRDAACR